MILLGWPEAAVAIAVLAGGASVARNLIWARVQIIELRDEEEELKQRVSDELYLLRRDVDELKQSIGPEVLN